MGGYDDSTVPVPQHGEAAHIPNGVGVFAHPATRGVTEFSFKLELDKDMQDQNGLFWVMQRVANAIPGPLIA